MACPCPTVLLIAVVLFSLTELSDAAFGAAGSSRHWRSRQMTTTTTTTPPLSLVPRSSQDWDAVLLQSDKTNAADDNNSENDNDDNEHMFALYRDCRYIPRNCVRQCQTYAAIRAAGGHTHDVYARRADNDDATFWFVGKVARVDAVSVQGAIQRQWPLIAKHTALLRPLELYPVMQQRSVVSTGGNSSTDTGTRKEDEDAKDKATLLQLWVAPGDSEILVAYNDPDLVFERIPCCPTKANADELYRTVKSNMVGFQGEVYQAGEEGFRTWRLEDGRAARPPVQSGVQDNDTVEEKRPPTDQELEQIQKAFAGRDVNAIYEEQEERRKSSSN
jgi:hypothetical protein